MPVLLRTRRARARTCLAAALAACSLALSAPPAHAGGVAGTLFITWPGGQDDLTDNNYDTCYEIRPAGNTTITNALFLAAVHVYEGPHCPGGSWYDNVVWKDETDTYPHASSYMIVRAAN
ncbi:hypothetical protein SAMN05428938_8072 [Streptomyces sp. KS_5]|nr:hypothetical protein SAMN05428938_8072 [Streptomyces sp. KS_5]